MASAAAARLGCAGVMLDLDRPESWDAPLTAAEVVICCLDTQTADLARDVLARGGRYIDISATDAVLRRIEALDGLAQGLTNLLVRKARARCPEATRFPIGVLLGLVDSHGPAAIDWTPRSLVPLGRANLRTMRFGGDRRALLSIPFDFSVQHSLMRRGYPEVETRLVLASPLISPRSLRLLAWMAGRSGLRKALARSMPFLRIGSDRTALVVEANIDNDTAPACRLTLPDLRNSAAVPEKPEQRLHGTGHAGMQGNEAPKTDSLKYKLTEQLISFPIYELHYQLVSPGTGRCLADIARFRGREHDRISAGGLCRARTDPV